MQVIEEASLKNPKSASTAQIAMETDTKPEGNRSLSLRIMSRANEKTYRHTVFFVRMHAYPYSCG